MSLGLPTCSRPGSIFLCVAVFLAGCGPGSRRLGVVGRITYQGAPIREGTIQFEPVISSGGYSAGAIVKDGRYTVAARRGLLSGKYSVKISATEPIDRVSPGAPAGVLQVRELLPVKYNTQTTLMAEVTLGNPNQIDFELE